MGWSNCIAYIELGVSLCPIYNNNRTKLRFFISFFCVFFFVFRFVTRAIGAYQNKNGLHNNIGGGIVTGALAGYLLRDLKKLQIDKTFQRGRFVGGSFSIIGGAAIGCLIGGAWGTVQTFNRTESYQSSIRYWEKYWSAYEQEVEYSITHAQLRITIVANFYFLR